MLGAFARMRTRQPRQLRWRGASRGRGLVPLGYIGLEPRRACLLVDKACGAFGLIARDEACGMSDALAADLNDLPAVATAVVEIDAELQRCCLRHRVPCAIRRRGSADLLCCGGHQAALPALLNEDVAREARRAGLTGRTCD